MTEHDEQRDRTADDDTRTDIDDDVGSDPMHPHPQDRPLPDQTGDAESNEDPSEDPSGDDESDASPSGADPAGGGGGSPPGDVDDDSPVERYRDSPGLAVSDETRDVAEPNEPA